MGKIGITSSTASSDATFAFATLIVGWILTRTLTKKADTLAAGCPTIYRPACFYAIDSSAGYGYGYGSAGTG